MRFLFAFFLVIAACYGKDLRSNSKLFMSQNVTEMISMYGYPVQNFTVQTTDGYLLDVIRIPGGVEYKSQFEQKQQRNSNNEVRTEKPVVFLMHGLMSSAEDFVIGGPSEGLAFVLAERGYDVFLGNARGNIYARKHTTLNPDKDAAFWRFCWSDIGKKDLPAMIDEILRVTQMEKLTYVGHMQGTTAFYVMTTEMPEYNQKIEKMVSLGPIAFMKGANNKMLTTIAQNIDSKTWQMKNLGANEFHPSTEFLATVGIDECINRNINERICQNPFFLLNGYESQYLNMTTMNSYAPRLPAGASTKQVLHYARLMKSGRFEKYVEDENKHEEYDLTKITTPILMVWSPSDALSAQEDVQTLINKLPHVVEQMPIRQITNNLDLLFANNVKSIVYNTLIEAMQRN